MAVKGYEASWYVDSANDKPDYPMLDSEQQADVCVIGAGFTGLSAALHLAQRGYQVTVLDAERVGWGASGRNGGQVAPGHNMSHADLLPLVGKQGADALWQMGLESVALVKALITEHRINCELKQGVLHVAARPAHSESIQASVAYNQQVLGYGGCQYVPPAEVQAMLGTPNYYGGEYWTEGLHLHPLNYALGLAQAATNAGVKIFERSRVTHYRSGVDSYVQTERGCVRTRYILLACNGYLGDLEPRIAGRIMPINNFILATEPLSEARARRINRDDVAVADSRFVLNYFRLSADNRLLWGGGETYSKRFPADIRGLVRAAMLKVYPDLDDVRIDYGWGGTLAITRNRMPHFDRIDDNLFVAQGYSGHGVALATLGGKLMAEAISGTAERFDVFARVPSPAFPGGVLLRWPAMVAAMLWYSLRDRLP